MAFTRLASLASILAIASCGFTPPHSPNHCQTPWSCGGQGDGGPPALAETDLCLPPGVDGFCTLGVVMQPMPYNSNLPASTWSPGSFGDGNFTIYDKSCNLIGDYPNLFKASGYKQPLAAFFSELPYVMSVTTFYPPNGYGSNARLQFSYANFTSQVYDGNKQGTGCICIGTPSSTQAQWQQVSLCHPFITVHSSVLSPSEESSNASPSLVKQLLQKLATTHTIYFLDQKFSTPPPKGISLLTDLPSF